MNKKELISLKKELEKNCISLTKFLISYCGITNKDIHSMKISHQDITKLMPQLKIWMISLRHIWKRIMAFTALRMQEHWEFPKERHPGL